MRNLFQSIKYWIASIFHPKPKNKTYGNKFHYPTTESAERGFNSSKKKLFDINAWSQLKGFNSTFQIYDIQGQPATIPQIGYFIRITLPGLEEEENWVKIYEIHNDEKQALFTVHPSRHPDEKQRPGAEVKHFFSEKASSTFKVSRRGNTVSAMEIGRNETINNQGSKAGDRKVLNTLVAKGGWFAFQKLQWEKLTDWLVRPEDGK